MPRLTEAGGEGDVTTYGSVIDPRPSEGGACNYGSTSILSFAAINVSAEPGDLQGQWRQGQICGQCARVWALTSTGTREVTVRIVDRCADAFCGIDLGGQPAAVLMGGQAGRYAGGWEFVSCTGVPGVSDGVAALHVNEGSSQGWATVQVRNPPAALAGASWVGAGASGELAWATELENYLTVPEPVRTEGSTRLSFVFADGSSGAVTLTAAQITTPGADYPLALD